MTLLGVTTLLATLAPSRHAFDSGKVEGQAKTPFAGRLLVLVDRNSISSVSVYLDDVRRPVAELLPALRQLP